MTCSDWLQKIKASKPKSHINGGYPIRFIGMPPGSHDASITCLYTIVKRELAKINAPGRITERENKGVFCPVLACP
jgi:hypothetical protein